MVAYHNLLAGSSRSSQSIMTARSVRVPSSGSTYKVGTRLVRSWKGELHEVTVLEQGFEHRGQRFNNLSVIAREITGTRWSGPAFFGLREKAS